MGRTGGEKTKKKILATAEQLFAEKGYDGTGIQDIATAAGINKALIYYHFKNKRDIVDSLFQQTLDEMFAMQGRVDEKIREVDGTGEVEKQLTGIISFLEKKRKILSVMLMESLKQDSEGYLSLFQCAKVIIEKNIDEIMHNVPQDDKQKIDRDELLMHEFYTGFLPIVFFALFKDRWADFFECNREEAVRLFMKVFIRSHIQHIQDMKQ
jgi:AcrR family transcriptional regulator